jgi:hypothetical protein
LHTKRRQAIGLPVDPRPFIELSASVIRQLAILAAEVAAFAAVEDRLRRQL